MIVRKLSALHADSPRINDGITGDRHTERTVSSPRIVEPRRMDVGPSSRGAADNVQRTGSAGSAETGAVRAQERVSPEVLEVETR